MHHKDSKKSAVLENKRLLLLLFSFDYIKITSRNSEHYTVGRRNNQEIMNWKYVEGSSRGTM
jgi:hypothetical protein